MTDPKLLDKSNKLLNIETGNIIGYSSPQVAKADWGHQELQKFCVELAVNGEKTY